MSLHLLHGLALSFLPFAVLCEPVLMSCVTLHQFNADDVALLMLMMMTMMMMTAVIREMVCGGGAETGRGCLPFVRSQSR